MTSRIFARLFLFIATVAAFLTVAYAQIPGQVIPDTNLEGDQKAGSALIYTIYSSKMTNLTAENTRISLTNTDDQNGVITHLFWVDGNTCSVADMFLCLTKSQTAVLYAAEMDPDITGYLVVVAIDNLGLPTVFNKLVGNEFIKLESGHSANVGAEAIAKLTNTNVVSTDGTLAALFFDGLLLAGSYSRVARAVAVDNFASPKDGNDTLLVLDRIGGNLASSASTLPTFAGLLYDDAEIAHSYGFNGGKCQVKFSINDSSIRTVPRLSSVVPAGRSGWMKFWPTSDVGILGTVLNKNSVASATSFNGGRHLHKLSLSAAANYVVPVFVPTC